MSHGGLDSPPLAEVDAQVLIDWCGARSDSSAWPSVAAGIRVWSSEEDLAEVTLSESAVRLLEAATNPEAVLDAYAERISPSSWSGSMASAMQPRAAAIAVLVTHESAAIAAAAKAISEKIANRIERERLREQGEDERREQRFE